MLAVQIRSKYHYLGIYFENPYLLQNELINNCKYWKSLRPVQKLIPWQEKVEGAIWYANGSWRLGIDCDRLDETCFMRAQGSSHQSPCELNGKWQFWNSYLKK